MICQVLARFGPRQSWLRMLSPPNDLFHNALLPLEVPRQIFTKYLTILLCRGGFVNPCWIIYPPRVRDLQISTEDIFCLVQRCTQSIVHDRMYRAASTNYLGSGTLEMFFLTCSTLICLWASSWLCTEWNNFTHVFYTWNFQAEAS